jgi:hypothetical protein
MCDICPNISRRLTLTTEAKAYPVTLKGELVGIPSRGLWLVKWFLAIPHWFLLIWLGIASVVASFISFWAIVFTGKYPKGFFNFSVGVMRWAWRTIFYAIALGTDIYPPFSLDPDPNYPADLDVPYPEKLHRGLVWVKWFLNIPHYLVTGLFWWISMGGGNNIHWQMGVTNVHWMSEGSRNTHSTPGLVFYLVIFAGICLLFAHKYPRDIFRLVVGASRWLLRVLTYPLMTDEYPPFRFWDD